MLKYQQVFDTARLLTGPCSFSDRLSVDRQPVPAGARPARPDLRGGGGLRAAQEEELYPGAGRGELCRARASAALPIGRHRQPLPAAGQNAAETQTLTWCQCRHGVGGGGGAAGIGTVSIVDRVFSHAAILPVLVSGRQDGPEWDVYQLCATASGLFSYGDSLLHHSQIHTYYTRTKDLRFITACFLSQYLTTPFSAQFRR